MLKSQDRPQHALSERRPSHPSPYQPPSPPRKRSAAPPLRPIDLTGQPAVPNHTRWSDGNQEQASPLAHPNLDPFLHHPMSTPAGRGPGRLPDQPVSAASIDKTSSTAVTSTAGASDVSSYCEYRTYVTPSQPSIVWKEKIRAVDPNPRLPSIPLTPLQLSKGEIPHPRPFSKAPPRPPATLQPPTFILSLPTEPVPAKKERKTKVSTPKTPPKRKTRSSKAKPMEKSAAWYANIKAVRIPHYISPKLKRMGCYMNPLVLQPEPSSVQPCVSQLFSPSFQHASAKSPICERLLVKIPVPIVQTPPPIVKASPVKASPVKAPNVGSGKSPAAETIRPANSTPQKVQGRGRPRGIYYLSPPTIEDSDDEDENESPTKRLKISHPLKTHAMPSTPSVSSKARILKPTPGFESLEHQQILAAVLAGKNVFFTGSAGTGKTHTIKALIKLLKTTPLNGKRRAPKVAITATTGIAAVHIGGQTINSWAGVGLLNQPKERILQHILLEEKDARGKFIRNVSSDAAWRWRSIDLLIIDEASMLSADHRRSRSLSLSSFTEVTSSFAVDTYNWLAQQLLGSSKPFGGIQVILVGDFFQLPPVPSPGLPLPLFCFDATCWKSLIEVVVQLKKVYRQSDPKFISVLNEIREGKLSQETIDQLRGLSRPLAIEDCTELYPTNAQTDIGNDLRLQRIKDEARIYDSYDYAWLDWTGQEIRPEHARRLLGELKSLKQKLSLKIGARVMLQTNASPTLCNGSMGTVVAFESLKSTYHRVLRQPGSRLEAFDLDWTQIQVDRRYTAKHAKKLRAEANWRRNKAIQADPNAYKGYPCSKPTFPDVFPVVRFENGQTFLIPTYRHDVTTWSVRGRLVTQVSRTQLPLKVAYAMTVHKSQGQSLEAVKIDCSRIRNPGQAYVALSRCTTLEGLQILNFDPFKVITSKRVVEWHAENFGSR